MPTRAVFRCQFCDATPDHGTQRSLQGQVTERMFGEYLDAFPGRWLVWNGGGPLGPRRYACRMHRGDLVAYLRYHYATVAAQVWKMPPYQQRWPDEKRPHMGGSMGIVKFGLRGGLLQDAPPTAKAHDKPATAEPQETAAEVQTPAPPLPPLDPDDSPFDDLFPPGALYLPEDMTGPASGDDPPPGPPHNPEGDTIWPEGMSDLPPPPEGGTIWPEGMSDLPPPPEGGTTWPEGMTDLPPPPEGGTMWPDDEPWPPGFPPEDHPPDPPPPPT